MNKLYYGIKDGKIVSIDDVCSGKSCGCTCPSCGEQLVAKKGKINIHHFAHASQRNCEYGYESTLHLLAKDILKNSNYFVLPKEKMSLDYFEPSTSGIKYKDLNEPLRINVDKVEVELPFDDMKPDVVIYSGGVKYFIEIFVTHKIDEEKRNKIISKDVDTIEIDLSKIGKSTERDVLESILLNDDDRKYWIYNHKIENHLKKANKEWLIPTTSHGFAWHTEYCPINARNYRGMSYANVTDDCIGCEYCLGLTPQESLEEDSKVICVAAEGFVPPKKTISSDDMFCPNCHVRLVLKNGRFGKFYGCPNYPKCNYTRNYYNKY